MVILLKTLIKWTQLLNPLRSQKIASEGPEMAGLRPRAAMHSNCHQDYKKEVNFGLLPRAWAAPLRLQSG